MRVVLEQAAFVVSGVHATLYTSKADGAVLEETVIAVFTPIAHAENLTLNVVELVPTVPGDSVGNSLFFLGLACREGCQMPQNLGDAYFYMGEYQIADGNQAPQDLKDLVVVRLGYIAADSDKPEPLIPRLQAIADKASPWRYSAREAIGLLTAKAGQREQAAKMFSDLAQAPGAPTDLAQRAGALAELYRGK